jgi:heme-degrading monooxygenase HmoA
LGKAEARVTIVSVLSLSVRDGAGAELARMYDELEVFEHAQRSGGFRGGRLLRPLEDDGPYLVVAEWESAEAYQGWLDNPVRAELGQQLEPLLSDDVVAGRLFEEV